MRRQRRSITRLPFCRSGRCRKALDDLLHKAADKYIAAQIEYEAAADALEASFEYF